MLQLYFSKNYENGEGICVQVMQKVRESQWTFFQIFVGPC